MAIGPAVAQRDARKPRVAVLIDQVDEDVPVPLSGQPPAGHPHSLKQGGLIAQLPHARLVEDPDIDSHRARVGLFDQERQPVQVLIPLGYALQVAAPLEEVRGLLAARMPGEGAVSVKGIGTARGPSL